MIRFNRDCCAASELLGAETDANSQVRLGVFTLCSLVPQVNAYEREVSRCAGVIGAVVSVQRPTGGRYGGFSR